MYDKDVPMIAAAMRACPDVFMRGAMFAVISARVPFPRVPEAMAELERREHRAACLWGWKLNAYHYLAIHKARLHAGVLAAGSVEEALAVICEVPGLGVVKGGFVLQLMGFDIGCLDTRNIKRLGLSPRTYRSDGAARKQARAWRSKLQRYVSETGGRARELWDDWCQDTANSYSMTAAEVSAMHRCFLPRGTEALPPAAVPVTLSIPF